MKSANRLGRIPGAHKARDKRIVKKYLDGKTQKELAVEYGLSIASIRKICAGKKTKEVSLVIDETPYLYQASLVEMVERLNGYNLRSEK
jgi:hypothetical protein